MHRFSIALAAITAVSHAQALGPFESHSDIGTILHRGSADYDAARGTFTVFGSGENMWARNDDFHFVWKKVSGDISIAADIVFPVKGGNAHKKAVLMIRQSLDADSAYVDAALHSDGLTSIQARDSKGGPTHEIGINAAAPRTLRLDKRGDDFYMFLAREGEDLRFAGGSQRLRLTEPFYVGIGVCAHDKDVTEQAVFSNVRLGTGVSKGTAKRYSTLETVRITAISDRRVVYVAEEAIGSPAWSDDGKSLVFSVAGSALHQIAAQAGAAPERFPGKLEPDARSGPYFVSDRGQIMRRDPGGAPHGDAEQMTDDGFANSHPHVSPDGLRMLFLSSNSADKGFLLRSMVLADKRISVIAHLADETAIGSRPWSPDSRQVTFVSRQLVLQ